MTAYEFMLSESQERMLMVLRPDRQDMARDDLREMGPRLRRHRGADQHRPPDRLAQRQAGSRHPSGPAERPGAALHPPDDRAAETRKAQPRADRGSHRPDRSIAKADRLPRPVFPRLGVGPVRQHRRRPDGQTARHRRCRRGEAGRAQPRPRADHRLHAALLPRRSRRWAVPRRWRRHGAI